MQPSTRTIGSRACEQSWEFSIRKQDESLIDELLKMMEKYNVDYTNTFHALTFDELNDAPLFGSDEFKQWLNKWLTRLGRQAQSKAESHQLMRDNNPAVIPAIIGWKRRSKKQ